MFCVDIHLTFSICLYTIISDILTSGLTIKDKTEEIMNLYENR